MLSFGYVSMEFESHHIAGEVVVGGLVYCCDGQIVLRVLLKLSWP